MGQEQLIGSTKKAIDHVFEARRLISNALALKEENVEIKDIKGTNRKEIDSLVWNELGIYFLNNRMFSDAILLYEHMLSTISHVEKEKTVEIHKGLPLHNIGVAQINMRNYDEGIPNILKAYDEDKMTHGEAQAKSSLANQVKEGLFDFICRVVDTNFLTSFNNQSGLNLKDTMVLLQNMDETEKLFFAKTINSKKLVSFHDDMYTRIIMLDNLRNLTLLLESNLKRRSKENKMLHELITTLFSKEEWTTYFETNKELKIYVDGAKGFQQNLKKISVLKASGKPIVDFLTNNFLTIALVRNFTAHYLVDELDILKNDKDYDEVFAKEVYAVLFSLNYNIT